jgi:sigma-B regulation protein RsbU (phosphoserine phosphatase)
MSSRPTTLLERRSELLDFLLEVAEVSSQTLELDRLLPELARLIKKVIDYEIFAILLLSERSQTLKIQYAIGHREEVIRNLRIPLGEGITGAAAAARKAVNVGDVRRDPRYLNALDIVRSELAVPMMARGRVVGVIDIQATRLDAFSEPEVGLVELTASRMAMAIDNARLYRRVVRQNRTLRTLVSVAQEFSSNLDLDLLLRSISEQLRKLINYDAFSIMRVEESQAVLRDYLSVRYDQRVPMDNVPLGKGIVGTVAEQGQPVLVPDTSQDQRYIPWDEGIRSEVAVPLIVRNRVIGVLDLESEQVNYFTEEHVRTLSLLAPQIAAALENAQLYKQVAENQGRMQADLRAARRLQQHLLPECCPRVAGLEISARCEPAREIGGDLYDFLPFPKNRLSITIGDVSGKGAAAALYGALVSGILRPLAREHRSPAQLLRALNQALVERQIEANYVALLAAWWQPDTRQLTLANAGLPLPIVCREGRLCQQRVEGIPLGLLPHTEYEEVTIPLEPGDLVVFASDGITDARDNFGQEYGHERLAILVDRHCGLSADEVLEKIFHDVRNHAAAAPAFDDQTVVILKGR